MTWIVSILAAVLIGCAVMNYLLLVIGGISQRAKEMAVHQCYGAEARHIYQKVLTESVIHLLLSLTLAALLLFLFKDTIEELVGAPLIVLLLTGSNIWLIVGFTPISLWRLLSRTIIIVTAYGNFCC